MNQGRTVFAQIMQFRTECVMEQTACHKPYRFGMDGQIAKQGCPPHHIGSFFPSTDPSFFMY